MSKINLSQYGIEGTTEVLYNPTYEVLYNEETKPGLTGYDKGQVTELGAINVMTGVYTGRSPKDKFIVDTEGVHNEIAWGSSADYLAGIAFKAPATQAAKRELINFLMEKYSGISDLNKAWGSSYGSWNALYENRQAAPQAAVKDLAEFGPRIVERYFSIVRRVFKHIAPQKLYMGCRFAGTAPEYVIRIASEYVDVLSYNTYNFDETFFNLPSGNDIPLMIGEFHFGAMDRGLFHPGQVYTSSQAARAESIEHFVFSCLRNPNIVGTNWHQFSDQATSGRFDGENFQVGFTDVCDNPYPETISVLREIGDQMYSVRYGK
mgnify:CR=1 FL=1